MQHISYSEVFFQTELFCTASLAQFFLAINLCIIVAIEVHHIYILRESGF